MPERGPAQLLLLSFRVLARSGSRIGLAAILLGLLCLLPREEGVYHQAKTELAQSLRQAAWQRAFGGDQVRPLWPWETAGVGPYSKVPRLGLSATIQGYDLSHRQATPKFGSSQHSATADRQDPHLLQDPNDLDADDAGLTDQNQVLGLQALGCPATGPEAGARDPHLPCPHADLSLGEALGLIIQSSKLDKLKSQATSGEQKL